MIDYKDLIARCRQLLFGIGDEVADAIVSLRAELAACKADAERYRWMRARDHSLEAHHGNGCSCYHIVGDVRELKHGTELDIAIDAAIQQEMANVK
jgi:hypothetical protein